MLVFTHRLEKALHADQRPLATAFSISNCRRLIIQLHLTAAYAHSIKYAYASIPCEAELSVGDKLKSQKPFVMVFDPRSSIDIKSFFDWH